MENTPTSNTSESLVDLPIAQIKENPDNPRHLITPEMTEAMAASLKAVGLKNPVKVRKISRQLAVHSSQESQNPKPEIPTSATAPIGAPSRDDNPFEYELVSGHIRLAGAKILGWATIKALVKDLTAQEALLEAILDNRGQEMSWLDLYLSIEALMKADPNLFQKDVADRLEVDPAVVSRALKILPLLNLIARNQILENLKNLDDYHPSENAIFRLTKLTDVGEDAQKHLPDLVQMALGVVIRQKMAEPQVSRMVAAILKTGIGPEAYEGELLALKKRGAVKGVDPDDPNGGYWQNLPSNVQVKWNPQGYRVTMDLSPAEAPVGVYGAMAWLEHMRHKAVGTHDPRYAKSLPQMTEKNQKAYQEEQKAGGMNPAPTTAKSKSEAKPEIATSPNAPIGAAPRNDNFETVEPPSTIEENSPTPVAKTGGLGGLVMQAIKNRIGSNAQEVESNAASALVNDAQRAANTLVRQGMRKVFKDLI